MPSDANDAKLAPILQGPRQNIIFRLNQIGDGLSAWNAGSRSGSTCSAKIPKRPLQCCRKELIHPNSSKPAIRSVCHPPESPVAPLKKPALQCSPSSDAAGPQLCEAQPASSRAQLRFAAGAITRTCATSPRAAPCCRHAGRIAEHFLPRMLPGPLPCVAARRPPEPSRS